MKRELSEVQHGRNSLAKHLQGLKITFLYLMQLFLDRKLCSDPEELSFIVSTHTCFSHKTDRLTFAQKDIPG